MTQTREADGLTWHLFESAEDDPPLATFDYLSPKENAFFCANARSDLPILVQQVEQLREENEQFKAKCLTMIECCNVMANNFNVIFAIGGIKNDTEQVKAAIADFWKADKTHQSSDCGLEHRYEMERLRESLEQLRKERDELLKDKERLDWLEANPPQVQITWVNVHSGRRWTADNCADHKSYETLLAAIDAALNPTSKEQS